MFEMTSYSVDHILVLRRLSVYLLEPFMKKLILVSSLAAAFAVPTVSFAESNTTNPAATGSTAVGRLDFSVIVPAVLFVRIGTGNAVGAAANATIDSINFTVPATNIGDSTVINASLASGDLTNGAVTVRVFSNVGTNVTLNSNVTGPMTNGVAGDTIPWSQIFVTPAALAATTAGYTNVGITHPTFAAVSGNGTATTLTAASKLVRQEGKWTFTYLNGAVKPAGTYGTSANAGRVTYTATQL